MTGIDAPATDLFDRSLGKTYVDIGSAEAFTIFDDRLQSFVASLAERYIPGDAYWPAATAARAGQYIDAVVAKAPELLPAVAALADYCDEAAAFGGAPDFAAAAPADQIAAMRSAEQSTAQAPAFRALYELTCEAYYRDPAVVEIVKARTGFDTTKPMRGQAMPPFDESKLDRVRSLPPLYREV